MAAAKGIERKLDELGRICIPKEYRRSLDFTYRCPIDIYAENNIIYLKVADKNNVLGIVRRIDELGRITLPVELRATFKLKVKEKLDMYLSDNKICLEPAKKCVCCGALERGMDLIEYKDTYICKACLRGFNEESKW